jgi:single-strand DNA-binding protein
MSDGMNQATLIGNLGADPDLRFTQGGTAVLNLRLATTTSYLDKDKKRQESTQWHTVTVWGARGEVLAKLISKGDRICVQGEIRYSEYEDKEGVKKWKTEIAATNVVLCGGGKGASRPQDDRPRDDRRDDRRGRDDRPRDDRRDDRRGGREEKAPWE